MKHVRNWAIDLSRGKMKSLENIKQIYYSEFTVFFHLELD